VQLTRRPRTCGAVNPWQVQYPTKSSRPFRGLVWSGLVMIIADFSSRVARHITLHIILACSGRVVCINGPNHDGTYLLHCRPSVFHFIFWETWTFFIRIYLRSTISYPGLRKGKLRQMRRKRGLLRTRRNGSSPSALFLLLYRFATFQVAYTDTYMKGNRQSGLCGANAARRMIGYSDSNDGS